MPANESTRAAVGTHLFDILASQGIQQRWFARQMGVDDTYISYLKAGRRPWTPELMERASGILRIPQHVLFFPLDSRPREDGSRDCEGAA